MNKDTFCGAPFYSMYIGPEGQFGPCCLYETMDPIGIVKNKQDIIDIYNSEKMVNLRKDLHDGVKVKNCFNCWRYQDAGQHSYRLFFNDYFTDDGITSGSINNDFKINDIKIRHFDIRFSNKCNLKCRTCNSNFSSSWFIDEEALNINPNRQKIKKIEDSESVLEFVFSQLENVESIYFAGGEPLMMDEHYQILERIIEIGRADKIKIVYSTNFSKLTYGKYNVIELWKHFTEVSVQASLDGIRERGEYIRKNIKWNEVEQNAIKLKQECPHVHFTLDICVSLMNAYDVMTLHKEWSIMSFIRIERINFNILDKPEHFRISNLPQHHKDKLIKLYEEHIEWIKEFEPNPELHMGPVNQFNRLILFINNQPTPGWEEEFWIKNYPVDRLRNENFFEIFTEYEDLKYLYKK